jgi:hypothetical protein
MLALIPPKTEKTNINVLFKAILKRMAIDGCFDGFQIYDAFLKKTRTYRIEFINFLEDLKGLPSVLCCSTTGTNVGVCPWCTIVGVHLSGSCRYFTAILMLPRDSPIRKAFAVEFSVLDGM